MKEGGGGGKQGKGSSGSSRGLVKGSNPWVESTREEPEGAKYMTYESKLVGGKASYLLYLPPDYEKDPNKRYPVLYEKDI